MPSAIRFITKDSHPDIRAVSEKQGKTLRGRRYHTRYATEPGGIRAAELVLGMQLACLAITDDKPDTLKNVGKANPWQVRTMTLITGSEEDALEPLSIILQDHFRLTADHIMDISGMSRAGHALDTQGYIAHNNKLIVLSYRCTTSASDWLTNLTTTSSAWDMENDADQGHSGFFSSCADYGCCSGTPGKPRVHTGFYNNFLITLPAIRKYIDPLLAPDQPPRTLYVVGHSLGAGIAIMAACYFLLEPVYDWKYSPHKLRIITAGGPRSCSQAMQEQVDAVLRELRPTGQAVLARLVRDKDVVPTVPPEFFGFRHLTEKPVYITKEDEVGIASILVNPDLTQVLPKKTLNALLQENPAMLLHGAPRTKHPLDDEDDSSYEDDDSSQTPSLAQESQDDDDYDDEFDEAAKQSKYERRIKLVPRPFRDHMPDFYLRPLLHLLEDEQATQNKLNWSTDKESGKRRYQPLSSSSKGTLGTSFSSILSSVEPVAVPVKKGFGRFFRLRKPKPSQLPMDLKCLQGQASLIK
jgi:pimeloyl-ACP methyl ester carboxylesterase